jgi:hypothetical protein
MAETTQPKTLSELKEQLSIQSTQTTYSQPRTLSELKALMSGGLEQPGNSKPKTLSDLKKQTFKDVKEEKVGAIKNLYRFGAGAIRDVAQVGKDNLQESLALQGKYDPIKAVYSKLIDVTPDLPEIEEPTTSLEIAGVDVPVGSFARDLAGIAIPFGGLSKAAGPVRKGASLLQKGIRSATLGTVAEQFAFSPTEERLSNFVQSFPSLQNPVTEFLQADEDDPRAVGRLKMAIEGAATGVVFETVFNGLRAIKNIRKKDVPEETLQTSESAVQKAEEANKEVEKVIPKTPVEEPGLTVEAVRKQRSEATKTPFSYDADRNVYTAKIKKDNFEIVEQAPGSFRVFKTESLTPEQINQRLEADITGELKASDLEKQTQFIPFEQTFENLDTAKRFVIEESRPTRIPSSLKEPTRPKVDDFRSWLRKNRIKADSQIGREFSRMADKTRKPYINLFGGFDTDTIVQRMRDDGWLPIPRPGEPDPLIGVDEFMELFETNPVRPSEIDKIAQWENSVREIEDKKELLKSFGIRPEKSTNEEIQLLLDASTKQTESFDEMASLAKYQNSRARKIEQDLIQGNVGLPGLKGFKDPGIKPPPFTEKDLADVIPRLRTEFEDYVKDVDLENKFTQNLVEPTKPGQQPEIQPKYIVNVNMNRLDTTLPERIKLSEIAEQYEETLEIARNVTRFGTKGENIKALADETGLSFEELMDSEVGVLNEVNTYKLRLANAEALKEITDLSIAMKDPLKRTPDLEYRFETAKARYPALLERLVGEAAAKGRVLNSFNIPITGEDKMRSKLIARYYKENKGNPEINSMIADAITKLDDPKQLAKFIRDMDEVTALDMITEGWINMILSAPPTHLVNIAGNSSNILLSIGEQMTAASYGLLKGAKEADRLTFKEVGARLVGNLLGFADGLKAGAKALIDEDFIDDPFLKVELARQRAIPGFAGKLIRVPTRFLASEDLFFKAINYRQSLMGLATRQAIKEGKKGFSAVRQRVKEILENPAKEAPDIDMQSVDYARYQTYTNPLGKYGQATQNKLSEPYWKLGRFIAPFIRTPVNIIKYANERTPLGRLSERYKAAMEAGGAEKDIANAKIVFTGAVMSVLGLYANQGLITGRGPEDTRERAVLRETGWQEYSIKVGDKYISYQRFEPFGILLGLTADFVNAANMVNDNILVSDTKEDKDLADEAGKIGAYLIASFADNITNKTYLRGVSDVIKAIDDPERYGPQYINNFLSSPIPNVSGYVRRYNDPVIRDVRNLMDAWQNKIPGMSASLPAKRNIFGEVIKYSPGAAPEAFGRFGEVFSPARLEHITNDIVFNELLNIEYYPSMPKRTIQGVDINPEQYEYMMAQHQLPAINTKQRILQIIQSPEYKKSPKYFKKEMLKKTIETNNAIARFETARRYPELGRQMKIKESKKLEE